MSIPQVNDFCWLMIFSRVFFIFLLMVIVFHWLSFFMSMQNNNFKKMFLMLV